MAFLIYIKQRMFYLKDKAVRDQTGNYTDVYLNVILKYLTNFGILKSDFEMNNLRF
jgi:hypothetical protein